ncbi:MAG: P-II family nitrogen regulator [Thiomicrorhabdus chilensis]|uniref:P-II family nitrogen regulator n=1 Tax=Thiomicrorhabdus chilensis TaxID=63656 RepID=UPI00299D140A|nr:P-II family nitrogen regulator [Thiomicrorhabdus chilensis]MDX1347401.1 P-II family nitrogen regulator [Thiomicrorhabdus chilensis]
MKLIKAVINPYKLDSVRESLSELGDFGLTVSEVKGYGRQKGQHEIYRGAEYEISFVPKVSLEIAVADEMVDKVVALIVEQAKTGKIGDGKIFILPLEEVIRIRTSETGDDAL